MKNKLVLKDILQSSLTILEKKAFYIEDEDVNNDYLIEWKNKKNLVTEEVFDEILTRNDMNEKMFNFCISPIKLSDNFEIPDWLNELSKILECYDFYQNKNIKAKDITFVVFPFIEYVANSLSTLNSDNSKIEFSNEAIQDILNSYAKHIVSFIDKNVVIELEEYKRTHGFKSDDLHKQFDEFLNGVFGNKESSINFFKKYAVSTRIITMRTMYFINNIEDLVKALNESQQEMIDVLKIKLSEIRHIDLSVGDSHERGKGVVIIEFEDHKVVYKPKNLDICLSYEKFINWVNNSSGLLNLVVPKGIYRSTYALIEFFEYSSCSSNEKIKNYYERFGYTLALGYVLAMTDIHLENIIAYGEYPIIVDSETIFQNFVKIANQNSVISKFSEEFYKNTILATAMLPHTAVINDELDLSALAGDKQTTKRKYLTPVNIGTSNFHYEELEFTMNGSNNIPMLDGKKVSFNDYKYSIINGFNKMLNFIYNNKDYLMSDESPLKYFYNKKIRILAKGTQKYNDLLMFLTHPTCCKEMYIRERVLQNIWAYPHYYKDIIKSEYKDMLFNDIPIFYSTTSSKSIYDSFGNEYEKYFEKTGFDLILDRIKELDTNSINRQNDILLIQLGIYKEYRKIQFDRKNYVYNYKNINAVCEAEQIAKDLIETVISDEKGNIAWPLVVDIEDFTSFGLTSLNAYDGLSGIAVFFLELYDVTKKDIYYTYYKKCINYSKGQLDKYKEEFTAFGQKYSIIYPIVLEIKLLGFSKFEDIIDITIDSLSKKTKEDIVNSKTFSIDWISGISGLLTLLVNMFDSLTVLSEDNKNKILKITSKLYEIILEKLRCEDFDENVGQAHGYSGIMLALSKYCKICDTSSHGNIRSIVKKYLKKENALSVHREDEIMDKWCYGLSGMIISRIEILKSMYDLEIEEDLKRLILKLIKCQDTLYNGDSLCHGNAGTIVAIKVCMDNGYDVEDKLKGLYNKMLSQIIGEKLYSNKFNVLDTLTVNNPTLFTGNAGVGYMFLKTVNEIKHNILMLS